MKATITYELSPGLQKASMRAYFRHVVLKGKWLGVLGFLLVGGLLCVFPRTELEWDLGIAFSSVGLVLGIGWLKAYFSHMKIAAEILNLHDNKTITVTLSDHDITIDRVTSRMQAEWSKVSRVVDAGKFLVLLSGILPVANLPKEFLSEEQIECIRSHAKDR